MSTSNAEAFGSQGSYEGISDLLKCYICFDMFKDAVMCPHCSKMCCYVCIKKWISTGKPECPHCRAHLLNSDLIRVHSLEDLIQFVSTKQTMPADKEFCSQHPQMSLTVYCETCGVCICSNCALWGAHKENQGHSIKPLDDLYRKQKRLLEKKLSKLQERLKDILSLVEDIELSMDSTRTHKDKTQQEIDKVVENIFGRLNDQLRRKLQRLTDGKRYLKSQACQITTISTEIEGKIKGSQSLIVSQREELQDKLSTALKELESNKMSELEKKPEVGPFVNEIIPPYETALFEIKDFLKKQQSGEEIFSNQLTFCGLSWRLKVYPNGTEDLTGRYLGVFVELYDGYSQTAMYNYFVEMVHGAGHSRSSRSRNSNFKRDYGSDFSVGEAWGYKKFYEIKNLEPKGFLVKDTLLLKFGLRHPTFHQKCRDSMLYVNDLKHKIMALKHQNSQLRHKCEGITDDDDIALLKMKNKTKSPKDIRESSPPRERSGVVEKTRERKKREERVIDDTRKDKQPLEEEIEADNNTSRGGVDQPGSSTHHSKLAKTPISLSQPHLYSVHDNRLHSRSDKDIPRRSMGLHPTHSQLISSPAQRTRHPQQSQGMNYGHCIPHKRKSADNPEIPQSVILEQRRQSYDPIRMQQSLMYDQTQTMHPSQHQLMYPAGSLSQAEYMMVPHGRSEYYATIRENAPDQQMDYMSQSSPRRQPLSHQQRKDFVETDISYFMDDPGSTFLGDSNSQMGPAHNYYHRALSQELQESCDLSCDLSDIPSVNTPVDDSIVSQKTGYGLMEMSQPIDHLSYHARKKSGDSFTLSDMDHLSRSVHTLHTDSYGGYKGDNLRRKPVRTRSTNQRPSSHSAMKSMGSEGQLNMYGPPGLQSSILPRLTAPLEQLRPGSSSTLPHNSKGRQSHGGGNRGVRSQQKHQTQNSVQHPKQSQQIGGAPVNQTTPVPMEEGGSSEKRSSKSDKSSPQTHQQSSPPPPSTGRSSTSEAGSPSPAQHRMQQQSPGNNQKLRLSGRSYKMSKKCIEGRSSPSKSTLSNSYFKQSDNVELTLEVKTTPPDGSGNASRLTVGGNITNNTSLSQLDKLL